MLLGVISDSHDHLTNIDRAIDLLKELGVQGLVHAGDFVAPFAVKRLIHLGLPIWAVRGNNDGEVAGLRNSFNFLRSNYSEVDHDLRLGDRRLVIQHIPHSWNDLLNAESPPDVLIFGHTHQPYLRRQGEEVHSPNSMKINVPASCPTLILNPGELCGWMTGTARLATLDLDTLRVERYTL